MPGRLLPRPPFYTPPNWTDWCLGGKMRSDWLARVEADLKRYYPRASRADIEATARAIAPFPLATPPTS